MSNKAYVYDPITREFVGVALLDKDPLGGGWLIPANAVQVKPDVAGCPDNKTLVLNEAGTAWLLVDDYRGETVYRIADGQPTQVSGLGALSADNTLIKPEPQDGYLIDKFDAKLKKWTYRKDWTNVVVYRKADGSLRTLTANDLLVPDGYTVKPQPTPAHVFDAQKSEWILDSEKQASLEKQAIEAADAQLTCLMSQMCAWLTIESYKPKTEQRGGNILSPAKIDEMLQGLPSSVETDLMRNAWSRATSIEFASATTQSFAQILGMSKDQLRVAMTEARGL